MSSRTSRVAPLLFFSGLCALIYQVVWLRELRLIFGASTAASAAVLAVFMGGLGVGGLVLGHRADRRDRPLMMYANLELLVAVGSALTPLLVSAARKGYLSLGGAAILGDTGATMIRLVLTIVVLGATTFLMGGTLPAAARAVSEPSDQGRRGLAVLYGVNTLGGVLGAFAANFLLIEVFGNRLTLWLACLVNALVGMVARSMARSSELAPIKAAEAGQREERSDPVLPRALLWFPSTAAAVVGFAFLLMELVWYRMLGPILGGSSYSFGLVLCVALFGIGAGGALYSVFGGRRTASLSAFAWTCAIEAACIGIPFALGDRIAVLALMLRPLGGIGFGGHVVGWTVITSIVVLPAALVAGYQFPLIVALFGRGGARVGRHVGIAYAANTAGAIAGSLAGGFGLIPWLGATGCWKLGVVLLAALALVAIAAGLRLEPARVRYLLPFLSALGALALTRAVGPTPVWRHTPIGAGRSDDVLRGIHRNRIVEWMHNRRRDILWEADGVESSVALNVSYSFIVNGKSDGNVRSDAGTQVMAGLIGTALLPSIRNAMVIGLGTGSTAGWLAQVEGLERVDVAELEPAIVRVARDCAPVNQNVLDNPKVRVQLGDAREILLTTRERYDLVFSEPSNPYRAGISSLYSREFYEAGARVLGDGGLFVQWLQQYDIDGQAVDTAIATLHSVFPHVSIWRTEPGDLILIGARQPQVLDADALRARMGGEPYRSAMNAAWRMAGLEALLAHHLANPVLADKIAASVGDRINLDDSNVLEYAFARSVGKGSVLDLLEVEKLSRTTGTQRPEVVRGSVDWEKVDRLQILARAFDGAPPPPSASERARSLAMMARMHNAGDLAALFQLWNHHKPEAETLLDLAMFGEAAAVHGEVLAESMAESVRAVRPSEAEVILAHLRFHQNQLELASQHLVSAWVAHRTDPWPSTPIMSRSLDLALRMAAREPHRAEQLSSVLETPFATGHLHDERLLTVVKLAALSRSTSHCVRALQPFETAPVWQLWFLEQRVACYVLAGDSRAAVAQRDLQEFLDNSMARVGAGLAASP